MMAAPPRKTSVHALYRPSHIRIKQDLRTKFHKIRRIHHETYRTNRRGTLGAPNKTSGTLRSTRGMDKFYPNQKNRSQDLLRNSHISPNNFNRGVYHNGEVANGTKNSPRIGSKKNPIHKDFDHLGPTRMNHCGQPETKFTKFSEHGNLNNRDVLRSERKKIVKDMNSFEPNDDSMKSAVPSSKYDEETLLLQKKRQMRLFEWWYDRISKRERGKPSLRIDLRAWKIMSSKGKFFKPPVTFGPINGVEVGDRFDFRLQLVIMGIHSRIIRGIDYVQMANGQVLATSIVATQGYYDSMVHYDELVYTGEGGTFEANGKDAKDQELKGGNLALKNSMEEGNYVRVVRGIKSRGKKSTSFIYDGLYKVVACYMKMGPYGKMHLKFKLLRFPGQKSFDWKRYYF